MTSLKESVLSPSFRFLLRLFLCYKCRFRFVTEICDLPASVQKVLFKELLDQDVQKGENCLVCVTRISMFRSSC